MSTQRQIRSPDDGIPRAARFEVENWKEFSLGDSMHKLIFVEEGIVDLEGDAGGWLIIPNHIVFIPADRPFAIRAARAKFIAVHLAPFDTNWQHHGCWVTAASPLSQEMVRKTLDWSGMASSDLYSRRVFFNAISSLCKEWFSNPRMLWVPAVKSEELRAAVRHICTNLADVNLESAATAAGLSVRTFQRKCETELDLSWREFLREIRIMRAMELLASTQSSIASVATATGFQSQAAFATAFSDRLGLSPSLFVKKYGGVC